jgi:uncharacterized membrane protein
MKFVIVGDSAPCSVALLLLSLSFQLFYSLLLLSISSRFFTFNLLLLLPPLSFTAVVSANDHTHAAAHEFAK